MEQSLNKLTSFLESNKIQRTSSKTNKSQKSSNQSNFIVPILKKSEEKQNASQHKFPQKEMKKKTVGKFAFVADIGKTKKQTKVILFSEKQRKKMESLCIAHLRIDKQYFYVFKCGH